MRPRRLSDPRRLSAAAGLAALLCGPAGAEVLARAWVPNAVLPQGEVRLLSLDGEVVVQSVLRTRFEGRVESHIAGNERRNWGDHADAAAYVAALEEAFREYKRRTSSAPGALALVIDFASGPDAQRVDFRFAPVSKNKEGLQVGPAPSWRTLSLSAEYIMKNQERILADAMGDRADEARRTLRNLRPSPSEGRTHE